MTALPRLPDLPGDIRLLTLEAVSRFLWLPDRFATGQNMMQPHSRYIRTFALEFLRTLRPASRTAIGDQGRIGLSMLESKAKACLA